MITFIRKRPWIWIVFAFVVLIASWVVLLRVAADYRPAQVDIETVAH